MSNASCERGNGMIEMLLYAPLGMFFLFLVTDAGMALFDRSAVVDSARAALVSHPLELSILETYSRESGFDVHEQRLFLDAVLNRIVENIERARQTSASASPPFIRLALVRLEIDPTSGALGGYHLEHPDAMQNSAAGEHCGTPLEDFVRKTLEPDRSRGTSSFALPLAQGFSPQGERFLGERFLIASQICGRSRGLSGSFSSAFLGRFFEFHDEQLLPIRAQQRET